MNQTPPIAAPDALRRVMAAFPTGVAVVTARDAGGEAVGLTVNSFTSVSLDPPLVLVCLDHGSASHAVVLAAGTFAVNFLPRGAEAVSETFARGEPGERFQGLAWREEVTGSPVLGEALGWLDCRVHQTHVAGDHTIVVGRVLACAATESAPLVYWRGGYREVTGP
ncbi:MAG: flavin reductase family protein [Longimicrobiales bacterium]|nr:flavin reductase family protein [Longimicrobiales bacterium]